MATVLLVLIYVAFVSLGLPDPLLGAAWPAMRPEFNVPVSFAGILQIIIAGGTIISSMNSGRVLRRFGTGRVTAFSVGLTAIALIGFAVLPTFWWLIAAAIPLGLGAGSVDTGLNAFVAEHYESRHMSWLHSFWGVGAFSGPLVLAFLLRNNFSWRVGYFSIGLFQWVLVVVLILSIPLWKKVSARSGGTPTDPSAPHPSLFEVITMRGVPFALLTFLFYCGIEASMGLWGGTYLVTVKGFEPATAASWVSAFFASITAGRFLTGFATFKMSNNSLIRSGAIIIISGIILMLVPLPSVATIAGFLLIGFGCAPIFPCMIHETPVRFGSTHAQSVMGVQMAFASIGITFLPPVFGFISAMTGLAIFPLFLLGYLVVLFISSERLRKIRAER